MAATSDAIIIGAGIHGASLAFHLIQRCLRPIILERRLVASGATGRSSGLVQMHYDLKPEAALAWASYRGFRDWSAIVGGECGFTRTGFLQIVAPDHNDRLRANVAMHQKLGIPSLVVGADDVRQLSPAIVADLSPIELRDLFQGVYGAGVGPVRVHRPAARRLGLPEPRAAGTLVRVFRPGSAARRGVFGPGAPGAGSSHFGMTGGAGAVRAGNRC